MRKFISYMLIVLALALVAAWPLFSRGFIPTHDGEYHLIRFFEFEKMLKNGYWFPRWAPGLNSGYGVPLFNFHYPLPNYLGVLYHVVGFSLTDSFKLTLATGYLAAVIFCFLWLSKIFSKSIATAAAIIFAFVPYWFVDIYVRGSLGEVLALAWLMLAFASIERNLIFFFVPAVAGMILSHNILTLIFLPVLFGYLLVKKSKLTGYTLVGLGLSAYFWIPALAEQKYVVGLNTVNYFDHFPQLWQLLIPAWGTGFSGSTDLGNEMSFQIGIVPLFILFLSVFLALKEKVRKIKIFALFFILLAAGSMFLTLNYSVFVWKLIPPLALIQYPWRFLSVILPISGFLSAYIFNKLKKRWFVWGSVFLAVTLAYSYSRPVVYSPRDDAYYLTKTNFTDGTSSLGNAFSTRWASWKGKRPEMKIEFVSGSGRINFQTERPLKYEFTIDAKEQSTIRVNTLYYPGWTVTVDSHKLPIDYEHDGTIAFSIPAGFHRISIFFTETPLRFTADTISILSLSWFLGWAILKKYYEYRHRRFAA